MTRATRIVGVAVLLAALMGADGRCERGKVDTDRPPQDRQVDPKKKRLVLIRAHGTGPYHVLVAAQEVGRSGVDKTGPLPVARGEYTQTLSYTSGLRIRVRMDVRGNGEDLFHCQLIDGAQVP